MRFGLGLFSIVFWGMIAVSPGFSQDFGSVNFEFNSDVLDSTAQQQIEKIAEQIKETNSYKPSVIVGYTDAVGTSGYNFDLGLRRAKAVSQALLAAGVEVGRIGTIESRGKDELLVAVATPERQNRRVTVGIEDVLKACPSYRSVELTKSSIGGELQADLVQKLQTAVTTYDQYTANGSNSAAFQMAGAAREDCGVAVGFADSSVRKLEYSKKCFCNSARLQVALGRIPEN